MYIIIKEQHIEEDDISSFFEISKEHFIGLRMWKSTSFVIGRKGGGKCIELFAQPLMIGPWGRTRPRCPPNACRTPGGTLTATCQQLFEGLEGMGQIKGRVKLDFDFMLGVLTYHCYDPVHGQCPVRVHGK